MNFDFSATIKRLGGEAITVLRPSADSYVNGIRVAGARATIATTGSAQPSSPSDIQRLPEGSRSRETRTVFVPMLLKSADDRTGTVADRIQLADGRVYEVAEVLDWNVIAVYCKAICLRVEG